MDTLTKQLIDKSAAFSSAFSELFNQDTTINSSEVQYLEDKDMMGKFVRAYHVEIGYSSKFYYA